MQKKQSESQADIQLEQLKAELESRRMMQEAQIKQNLLQLEYQLKGQLEQNQASADDFDMQKYKEDRKDERTKMQATQQSELIDQRNNEAPAKDFQQDDVGKLV